MHELVLPAQTNQITLNDSYEIHINTRSLTDEFCFGKFWSEIKPFAEKGLLFEMISRRRDEIKAIKEEWRIPIKSFLTRTHFSFYEKLDLCLKKGTLVLVEEGLGGTYYLLDQTDQTHFVVKPIDEDILCLNNRKNFGTPFRDKQTRVRTDIPLYRSCQTSAAASAIAKLLHFDAVTPTTHLAVIKNDLFYDLSDVVPVSLCGFGDKEKLCSVQEYLQDSKELYEHLQELLDKGLSDQAVGDLIDQDDFERANIFIWLCFDNDAHAGNFRTYKKTNQLFGLKKIDNNLTFPENNSGLDNCLVFFPNADKPLSLQNRILLKELNLDPLIEILRFYDLQDCIEAFKKRFFALIKLVENETLTIKEVNSKLLEIN